MKKLTIYFNYPKLLYIDRLSYQKGSVIDFLTVIAYFNAGLMIQGSVRKKCFLNSRTQTFPLQSKYNNTLTIKKDNYVYDNRTKPLYTSTGLHSFLYTNLRSRVH